MGNKAMSEKFVLSRLYLTLFVGFLFVALFTMTYTQSAVEGVTLTIYEIAMRQIIFALVGFTILLMSFFGGVLIFDWNNKHEPELLDEDRGWLLYGFIAMAGARLLGGAVTAIPLSSIGFLNGTIALTSAIFEEPIFCGIGLMLYVIFLKSKLFRGNKNYAMIGSTALVTVMFAFIHVGFYGLSLPVMLYLMVGRIVYNLAFLKTRTLLTSTVAHTSHNFIVAYMGV